MYDLKGFRQAFRLTQKDVADLLECGQANISGMEKVFRDLEPAQREKLIEKYGRESVDKYVMSDFISDIPDMTDIPCKSLTKGVPYYNVDFIGGFDIVLNEQSVVPQYLIDFQKYNSATCWCNVTGHSMEPEISHGDIIALKRIEDISFLPLGEIYAIVTTNDMRTIKKIGPASDESKYSLIPLNKSPEYGVQEIPKDKIRFVYQVLGCMKRL